jgi:hypothetical protein
MASAKKLTLKCTAINLLADGRQQVTMRKAAEAPTTKVPGGAMIVNPDEAKLEIIAEATDVTYQVGKEYSLALT